jgi:hypothetical protein
LDAIKVEHDDDDNGSNSVTFIPEVDSIDMKNDECFTPSESCIKMIEVEVSHVSHCVCYCVFTCLCCAVIKKNFVALVG